MGTELGYALVAVTIKSVVVIGLPYLIVRFFSRRISASEKFSVMTTSVIAFLLLAVMELTTCFLEQKPVWTGSAIAGNDAWAIVKILGAIWVCVAIPLLLLTIARIVLADWHCLKFRVGNAATRVELPRGVVCPRLVVVDTKCDFPCVKGLFFQTVFLPGSFRDWPEEDQRNVLLHESFHVARRDIVWKYACEFATAIFWFNPLIWIAKYQIELEQEKACDDAVLRTGVKADQYCETILMVARRKPLESHFAMDLKMTGRPAVDIRQRGMWLHMFSIWRQLRCRLWASPIQERILAILDARNCRRLWPISLHMVLVTVVSFFTHNVFAFELEPRPSSPVIVEFTIATSADDAEERLKNGKVDLHSRDIELCFDTQQEREQTVGLRFVGVGIPGDAIIKSAEIVFTGHRNDFTGSDKYRGGANLKIRVQPVAHAPPFSRARHDISQRIDSSDANYIEWRITEAWKGGQRDQVTTTPELRSLVQGIVGLPEWKPCNAIAFVIETDSFEGLHSAASFDSQFDNLENIFPPTLRIVYSLPD